MAAPPPLGAIPIAQNPGNTHGPVEGTDQNTTLRAERTAHVAGSTSFVNIPFAALVLAIAALNTDLLGQNSVLQIDGPRTDKWHLGSAVQTQVPTVAANLGLRRCGPPTESGSRYLHRCTTQLPFLQQAAFMSSFTIYLYTDGDEETGYFINQLAREWHVSAGLNKAANPGAAQSSAWWFPAVLVRFTAMRAS